MKRIKNKLKAVIFDMDGTIIKTEHIWDEATKGMLSLNGISSFSEKEEDILKSLSGIGMTRSAEIVKESFNLDDSIENIVENIKGIAKDFLSKEIEFIDGFESFHKKLQSNLIPTSIATNSDSNSLSLIRQNLNLEKFFGKNIYGIEMIGNIPKPNPDIFLHAAKKLNVRPEECVVFEDSIFGFEAAKSAGMKCIAIKNNINSKSLHMVNHSIKSYDEAEKALLELFF